MNTATEHYRQLDAVQRTSVNLGARQQVEGLLPVGEITENSEDTGKRISGQSRRPGVAVDVVNINLNARFGLRRGSSPLNLQPVFRIKRKRKWYQQLPDTSKLVFFAMNVVFLCFGIAMIAVGAVLIIGSREISVLVNFNTRGSLETESMGIVQTALLCLMSCGVVIFIISILGVCGLWRHNTCNLYAYCILVGSMLATKLIIASFAFYFQQYVTAKLSGPLQELLFDNYDGKLNSTNIKSRAFDYAHVLFGCCGVVSYTDFQRSKWEKPQILYDARKFFPLTCCRLKDKKQFLRAPTKFNFSGGLYDPKCPKRVASADNDFTGVPCDQKVRHYLVNQASLIYFIGLAVVCLEFVCIFLANGLISDIKRRQEDNAA